MDTSWLALTAFWIGLTHTLLGPDHYVPFVAMSRAGGWSLRRTMTVTLLCGLGHVGSSVLLGAIGLAGGLLVQRLTDVEETRGDWAAWLLIGFGLAYAVWGVGRALRGASHAHLHGHADGTWHAHEHAHDGEHLHAHESATSRPAATPWVLFVVFLFGPCEPLIPLFIYPAAEHSYWAAAAVAASFAVATLITMAGCVYVLRQGVDVLKWRKLERFSHALAGTAVLACGLAVKFGL